jgi:hypothetical protein
VSLALFVQELGEFSGLEAVRLEERVSLFDDAVLLD